MTNIRKALRHLNSTVDALLDHDVTILSIHIEENRESGFAHFVIHCKMDEWYMTWTNPYFSHREEFSECFDQVFVPFIDGKVFALIDREDV